MKKIFIIGEIGINHNGDIKTCENLIETADTVSEILDIKHAFRANIKAQKGLDL